MTYQIPLDNELIVDNFAGGGGASCGIEMALNRPVNIAINHDPEALQMHEANHPLTKHLCESVWDVDPREVCQGRPVALAWFSPDCKHFSKAKGGKPVEKKIRGLAWVVLRWADLVRPRVIMLENVEEFTTWGPLNAEGMPDPKKKGKTFRSFINALRHHGYVVEWRELRACDYDTPTIRKRLFMIARCDGQPIIWPEPTHSKPGPVQRKMKLKPWHTAAECIDWFIPCPSIFAEGRKLLAENTLRRVAKGFRKFVLEAPKPYIVNLTHGGREESLDDPFRTITGANRGEKALVQPYLTEHANASTQRVFSVDEPLRTQCAQVKGGHFAVISPAIVGVGGRMGQSEPRNVFEDPVQTMTAKADSAIMTPLFVGAGGSEYAGKPRPADQPFNVVTTNDRKDVIAPTLIEVGYGEAPGQAVRAPGLHKPLGTVVAGGRKHAIVVGYLMRHFGTSIGSRLPEPMPTVVSKSKDSLAALYLAQHNTERDGVNPGRSAEDPLSTLTTRGTQQGIVAAHITKLKGTSKDGQPADDPLHTVAAGGQHHALTCAYLVKYYGNEKEGHGLEDPAGTVTTKDRFGLLQVEGYIPPLTDDQRYNAWVTLRMLEKFGGVEPSGYAGKFKIPAPRPQFLMLGDYILVDIGMRMLAPRELYRAQGFPDSYIIDRTSSGKPITKTKQVKYCGNSVPPRMAKALVKANVLPQLQQTRQRVYA